MNLPVPVPVATIVLLILSNVFMTFAWYGHLRYKALPLLAAIVISWGIAFFEYLLQVPANRVGYGYFSGGTQGHSGNHFPVCFRLLFHPVSR